MHQTKSKSKLYNSEQSHGEGEDDCEMGRYYVTSLCHDQGINVLRLYVEQSFLFKKDLRV